MVKSGFAVFARGFPLICIVCASLLNFDTKVDATVSKISDALALKLTRLVFPDIKEDGTTTKSVRIRNFQENESSELSGNMVANVVLSMYVRNGTRRDLVLEIDVHHKDDRAGVWGGETLIALFRLAPRARLLDVVDVRCDRESGLWNKPAILPGTNSDAIMFYYSHLNASEEYFGLELIEIKHDKLVQSKLNLPLMYSAKTGNAEIAEVLSIETPKQGAASANYRVAVTGKLLDEDGGVKKVESKTFRSKLIFSQGHWLFPSCSAVQKSIDAMQKRFGFSNE
jgi:hypothetical protein